MSGDVRIKNHNGTYAAVSDANELKTTSRIIDSDGNSAIVNSEGELSVSLDGKIDTGNTTTTAMLADEVYTGTAFNICTTAVIIVSVYSDVASATDGLMVEYSHDGNTWYWNDTFTIPADTGKTFSFQPVACYYRVKYTNGGSDQTTFVLQSMIKKNYVKPSSHRIQDPIIDDDDAELSLSVIKGKSDDGIFRNAAVNVVGRIETVSQPYTYSISEGEVLNHTGLLKFGTRTSVAANTSSVIWEGTNALYTYLTSAEQLQVTSSSASDGVGGTGILTLTIEGLDANYALQSETITMNGITQVTTSKSYIRIFRAYGSTCGTAYTNVGNINITNNAGTIQLLYIPAGDGQTLMTIWTVPAGHALFITTGTFSTDSNKGARVSLFTRQLDGGTLYPWRIRYRAYTFSGNEVFPFSIPFKIQEKTDIEVRVKTPAAAGTTTCGATFEGWYEPV